MIDARGRTHSRTDSGRAGQVGDRKRLRRSGLSFLRSRDRYHHREHVVRVEARVHRLQCRRSCGSLVPAPISSMNASANSEATRKLRRRLRRIAVAVAAAAFFERVAQISAGGVHAPAPTRIPAPSARVMPAGKGRRAHRCATISTRGMYRRAERDQRLRSPTPSSRPAAAPSRQQQIFGEELRRSRGSGRRLARSAPRFPSGRSAVRASSMWATFAQAISSTKPTAPSSISNGV